MIVHVLQDAFLNCIKLYTDSQTCNSIDASILYPMNHTSNLFNTPHHSNPTTPSTPAKTLPAQA